MSSFTPFSRASHIMPVRTDAMFKYLAVECDYTGESEWIEGAVSTLDLTADDIATYATNDGDPWLTERRNVAPGPYLVKVDNNGLVWAMAYDSTADRDADYAELEQAYATWADFEGGA